MTARKKPHLKAIAGTDRPDRAEPMPVIEFPLVDAVPPPPDWLPNAHAVREWERLAPILAANKLLTVASLTNFGMLCSLHGKIVQLYAAGESPGASMIGALRNMSNDFGLTPMSQGKVKVGTPGAVDVPDAPTGNAFARNGAKHRAA